jgi:hypothetical protein
MRLRHPCVKFACLACLAVPAFAQGTRPLDVRGLNSLTWGLRLSRVAEVYPAQAFEPATGKTPELAGLTARLRTKIPVDGKAMDVTLYTRPGEDTLAGLVLALPDLDAARAQIAYKSFTTLYGIPQTSGTRTRFSPFGNRCSWTFRSSTITLHWKGWTLLAEFTPRSHSHDE